MKKSINTALLVLSFPLLHAAEKPNMVIYLADDHGCVQSGPYGDKFVMTPNMNKMAAEGMVFDRAFIASPASGPSRSALLSGLMPARNGAIPNHVPPREQTQVMVKQLQEQGYEVVAIGKIAHSAAYSKFSHFDFEYWNGGGNTPKHVEEYLKSRTSNKPLCLMVGDFRTHVTWTKTNIYNPDQVTIPDYLINTEATREHWARYLSDVTGLDKAIGDVDKLAETYLGKGYLFMYTADHGAQWPFGKWNLYDAGIRVPMIVRWPSNVPRGVRTNAMVSWIDLMPTLIDIAGGQTSEEIDGRSFKKVLLNPKAEHRQYIFTTHTGDGIFNVYPMRSVRTARFKYIRNLCPDSYHSNHSDISRKDGAGAYWDSWDEAAKSDPKAAAVVKKYYQRPAEEFFDMANDPTEQHNLIDNPKYKKEVADLSARLDAWIKEQHDDLKTHRASYPLSGETPHEIVKAKQTAK